MTNKLKGYFENTQGWGVLSTADEEGKVDAAIYARPHCMDDGTVAFIMSDRRTHHNLQSNPHAAYLFKEVGEKYVGKRLYLTKVREEEDQEKIQQLMEQRHYSYPKEYEAKVRYLVTFKIDKELPLIGAGEE